MVVFLLVKITCTFTRQSSPSISLVFIIMIILSIVADVCALFLYRGKCLHSAEKVWRSQCVVWKGISSILYKKTEGNWFSCIPYICLRSLWITGANFFFLLFFVFLLTCYRVFFFFSLSGISLITLLCYVLYVNFVIVCYLALFFTSLRVY